MKRILTIGLLFLFVNHVSSQILFDGEVTLKGEPLFNATVVLEGTTCAKFTNGDGAFQFTCDTPTTQPFALVIRYYKQKTARVEFSSIEEATAHRIIVNYTSKKKYSIELVKRDDE